MPEGTTGMKYFEEFTPGDTETTEGYQVTVEEIIDFAMKWDPQPMHTDPDAAKASGFGGLVASGVHLIAMAVRLLVTRPTHAAVIGALGVDQLRFLHPARPGDVVKVTIECMEARPSSTKADRGVVRSRVTLRNQRGEDLLTYVDALLVARRPAAAG